MADFRTIKCAMWREDDWFLDLPLDAKLLWIYLFSNPSASVAGIYRLSSRTMTNETGLSPQRIDELLSLFSQANKAHFADGVVWVVKMREHQASSAETVKTRIDKDVATIPKDNPVYHMYARRYGIDRVSIPAHTVTVTDTDTIRNGEDTPPAPRVESVSVGKQLSKKLSDLNAQVPAITRNPLTEKLLDVYGLRAMADAGDDGALTAMHEQAVMLYQMNYHTAESLQALEAKWYADDWRGQKGQRPTGKQFTEFASKNKQPSTNGKEPKPKLLMGIPESLP